MSRWPAALLLASAAIISACQETASSDVPPVNRIEVTPASATVAAGASTTLTAHVFGTSGNEIASQGVFWSSENAAVATVDQHGAVTGVAPGTVRVAASLGGQSGTASLTVTPTPVVLVRLRPPDGTVTIGKTLQLAADPLDNGGSVLTGRTVAWSSSSPSIATVSASGLVSGVAAGAATIHATVDGIDGTAAITVVATAVAQVRVTPATGSVSEGASLQLTGTPLDAAGSPLGGRVVTWSSSNASIASVSSTGAVLGVGAGSATITATCEGVRGTASITVTLVPVASVTIAPSNPTMIVGAQLQLDATVRDAAGNVLNGRTVSWSSNNTSMATVNASGLVTAVAVGTATITATSGGVNGMTTLTVSAVPVASVQVSPTSAVVTVGQALQLTATARDAQGNLLTGRTPTWTSSNAALASVSATGLVSGVSLGAVTITATIDGVAGNSTITIVQVPIASLTVAPNPASVVELSTLPLTATALDANQNVLVGRTIVWVSGNSALATVSSTGLVTGVAPGTTSIVASAPGAGVNGSTPTVSVPLTVTYAPVASVQVIPASASTPVGSTAGFTASLFDAGGHQLSVTGRTLGWVSLNTSIATVNASTGVATGVAAGSTTIRAQASSPGQSTAVTGDGALSVIAVAVASVSMVLSPDSVILPGTSAGLVTVLDASSHPIVGQTVTLSSNATSVATVSPASAGTDAQGHVSFTVTAVAGGTANITASAGGKNASHAFRVLLPVNSVVISPASSLTTVGAKVNLTVTALDVNNTGLVGRPCTISSNNTAVVTVSPTAANTAGGGKIAVTATAVGKGTATVTATCATKSGTATISVS